MSWSQALWRAKRRALLVHLAISALIFIPFGLLIVTRWFPPPLFFTDGGWQGLRLMLAIDMVLGPTLTLLIYNPAKSRLALGIDFGFIGLVQASALAFGAWSVTHERIEAVAFADGAFHAVPQTSFANQSLPADAWRELGEAPPYWVFVRPPANGDEAGGVAAFALTQGLERYALQFLYAPLAAHQDEILQAALRPAALARYGPAVPAAVDRIAERHPGAALAVIPLIGYYRVALLVFDGQLHLLDTLYPPSSAAHPPAR